MRAVRAGDPAAMERFITRMECVPAILTNRNRRFGRLLGPEELADLVQDTLVTVWRKLDTYLGESALESWVYPYCLNHLMNAIRAKQRRPQHHELEPHRDPALPDESIEQIYQRAELLHHHLERLGESHARVIRLRHFESLGFEEIARRLAIPASTAKAHYRRGIENLRAFLAPHLREEAP